MSLYRPVEVSDPNTNPPPIEQKPQDLPANQYRPHYQVPEHQHHKGYYHRIKDTTYGTWLCLLVGLVIVALFLFAIIYVPVQTSSNSAQISKLKSKVDGGGGGGSHNGITSISNRGEYDLSLCHTDIYDVNGSVLVQSAGGDGRKKSNTTDMDTYFVKAFIQTRYNVAKGDDKFFVIHYEMLSNFPAFSTIRLVESILDVSTNRLHPNRDILLCSNNPLYHRALSNVHKCSRLLNRTQFYPMIPLHTNTKGRDQKDEEEEEPKFDFPTDEQEEEEEEEEEEEDTTNDEITHLRFYKIYFYRETSDQDKHQFGEFQILTVRPIRCIN